MRLEIPCDDETAVSLFSRWKDEKYAFLLESMEGGKKWGRYSFIGLFPSLLFRSRDREVTITAGNRREKFQTENPLAELAGRLPPIREQGLPRFAGGLVGFVSYDAARLFEKLPVRTADDLKLPDFFFLMPRVILVLDNVKHSLQIFGSPRDEGSRSLIRRVLRDLKQRGRKSFRALSHRQLRWEHSLSRGEFEKRVKRIQGYIRAGDITQAVLSVRFSARGNLDPFQVYRRLRRVNPSPYLFYLQMGEFRIAGASPETMVRLENREAILRPIAGTRPRGATEEQDRRLEKELLADPKERAEHVMLVDLGRNDLGRVAEPGSVKVDEWMKVERYSHVMHIVSNVRASLAPGRDAFDLLRAAFPAGTLTGSPKIRAMEIIEEMEPVRRGCYGGCVGYFSADGNMDMAITIRSALFYKGRIYLQAGAGIVADSVPEKEYEECLNKAKGMMTALEGDRCY